jgi:hypothetical protein
MTDQTIANTATETGTLGRRLETVLHYAIGVVAVLSAAVAISRFLDTGLPGCASSRTDRTLASIVRANGLEGATIAAKREVARDPTEVQCAAVITAADGSRRDLTYRIFRNEAGRVRVSASWHAL